MAPDKPARRAALSEHEVEITVPRGLSKHVKVVEGDAAHDITVRVSKTRPATGRAVLGVIVK